MGEQLAGPSQPDFAVIVSALNKISDEACQACGDHRLGGLVPEVPGDARQGDDDLAAPGHARHWPHREAVALSSQVKLDLAGLAALDSAGEPR